MGGISKLMEVFDGKDESLVRYLLNEQSKDENEELEDQMAIDPELSDRAQVVEMNLIERYVLNHMNSAEKARFEKGFLLFPENRDQVEDARAFHQSLRLRRHERLEVLPPMPEKSQSVWFASMFRMPLPATAFAALVLITAAIVGIFWIRGLRSGEVVSNSAPNNMRPPEVSSSDSDNNDKATPGASENIEKASTSSSPNRNSPPDNELAKLNSNAPPVVISIAETRGRVSTTSGADSRGPGNSSENQIVKPQLIKIPKNAKRFTLTVSLRSDEYFKTNLDCSVDISNSKFQRLFPEGEGNYLKVRAEPVAGELPYRVSISVPTVYLKEGKLYYFRIEETDSLTPFKVKFTN